MDRLEKLRERVEEIREKMGEAKTDSQIDRLSAELQKAMYDVQFERVCGAMGLPGEEALPKQYAAVLEALKDEGEPGEEIQEVELQLRALTMKESEAERDILLRASPMGRIPEPEFLPAQPARR